MMQMTAFVLVLGVLAQGVIACAQDSSQRVDRIFAKYSQSASPGCSLGVIRDGAFLYKKSYGEASLELGVPLSPESEFYVGSISKQFTAASVVLAAEQGFLSLDDDVRKFIPELPDYGHTITLRQMLNQTSGFRDLFDLVYFSGHNPADFNSPSEILRLIERQRGLNNVPGDEWVYSNTNFFLLGVVLERATRKTLAEFAADNIFRPLGMTHTLFYDDASVVVPRRVAAYDPGKDGKFLVDWSTTYAIVGGGGLMTSVDDLLKWDGNFYANRLGKGSLIKNLETPGILNDGKKTDYGMGLIPGNYRGLPTIEHSGSLFGYRADLLRFPDQKFTVICLCNVSNADPEEKARQVADIFLESALQPESISTPAGETGLPGPAGFVGQYLDRRKHTIYSFTASGGHLRGWGSDLRRKSANQFYDPFGNVLTFEKSDDSMTVSVDINGETAFAGTRLRPIHLENAALQVFAGNYSSTEVDNVIQLSVEQGKLILKNRNNPPLTLNPVAQDEFEADGFVIDFHRDEHGRASGLTWSQHQARGVDFTRTT